MAEMPLMGVLRAMGRRKTVADALAEVEAEAEGHGHGGGGLKKCLTRWDVVAYGVSSTVGAGIFVITGQGARAAGPAVVISFLVASFCCLCSAFCYAEFAARVPVSGSAYTFSYVCLGEFAAWFVGWNLTLEYAISAAAVARTWANNLALFFQQVGVTMPDWLYQADIGFTSLSPLAFLICMLCTAALLVGAKESATLNKGVTVLNISCILFIIIFGATKVDTSYWSADAVVRYPNGSQTDNAPSECDGGSHGGFAPCGLNGVLLGAVKIFFSYIGFDSVTTLAEEVPNARRDIPFGVIVTLGIASSLYIAAALVVTGMQPWYGLDSDTPLASAFKYVGEDWAATVIATCTVTALTVTTLCSLFGQPRIFYRMAKDGLLFPAFARLSERSQVPLWGTLFSGVCAGIIAFCLDIGILGDMIAMGTLLAFTTVCGGIVILRVECPQSPRRVLLALLAFLVASCGLSLGLRFMDQVPIYAVVLLGALALAPMGYLAWLPRSAVDPNLYSVPLVPFFPLLGMFSNVYLICSNTQLSFYRLIVWTVVGCSLYFLYGIRHSRLGKHAGSSAIMYRPLLQKSVD